MVQPSRLIDVDSTVEGTSLDVEDRLVQPGREAG